MNQISFAILYVLCFDKILTKELHLKENFVLKDKDNSISDLTYGYDDPFAKNERFARHVELVTESVVEHLIKEIKKKYPKQNNTSKILQKLRMKLQRRVNKRNKQLRKKQYVEKVNSTNKD